MCNAIQQLKRKALIKLNQVDKLQQQRRCFSTAAINAVELSLAIARVPFVKLLIMGDLHAFW